MFEFLHRMKATGIPYTVQESARRKEFPYSRRWEINIVNLAYIRGIEGEEKAQCIANKLNVFQSEDLKVALRQQLAIT